MIAEMEFIKAKSIMSKVKDGSGWYGVDYNMNLYRGCCHGCIYCDSRSSCYNIEHFDVVRGKENALGILEHELRKNSPGVVGVGAMSDSYNPYEKVYEQTRGALKLFIQYGYGVSVDTKSDLVLRDIDLLKQISEKSNAIVKFTITTPRDELSRIIEPGVCESSKRFQAVKELNEAGIFTGIMLNPVLPYITDSEEDIVRLVHMAADNGARFVHCYMGMTLRDIQRQYYYDCLDIHFPGVKQKYMQRYGNSYGCDVPACSDLYKVFAKECQKYGILYKMQDIIKAYKKNVNKYEQLSLF